MAHMAHMPRPFLRRHLGSAACAVLVLVLFLSTRSTLNSTLARLVPQRLARRPAQLHYLIPASQSNVQLCYTLVSSAATQYPVPLLLGWNGTGDLDAGATHLAKLRAIQRYLDALPPRDDDDVALIVDGYDVLQQLPPDVLLARYFAMARAADASLAARLGLAPAAAAARGLRQAVFWGPDKVCWPIDWRAPRCWAPPPSTLGPHAFGPKSGNGDILFADPRWLNSGTLIGPVADVRRVVAATMAEVAATHDRSFAFSESDQFYLSNLFGRQEYWRSKLAAGDAEVDGGPPDRIVPAEPLDAAQAELHMAVEYESALFQTNAGNEPFYGRLVFNETGPAATMAVDLFDQGAALVPSPVAMPPDVLAALTRLYDAVPDAHAPTPARAWIRTAGLGVNYITRHIYALWHCTGAKDRIEPEFRSMWWYPFAESLMRVAAASSRARRPLAPRPIDGRWWAPKFFVPGDDDADAFAGAWSDAGGGPAAGLTYVPWRDLCGPHEKTLFRG